MSPYGSSCSLTSQVFDASESVIWDTMSWTSEIPTSTSLSLSYRIGNTATPDGSWTGFVPVGSSPASLGSSSRYIQYKADLAATDTTRTPALQEVNFTSHTGSDTTPPTITDRFPSSGATGVARASNITVTFSEPMNPATITGATFRLRAAGAGSDVLATVSYDNGVATLDPAASLLFGTQYQVTVSGTVTDLAGNPLGDDDTWSFTTTDQGYITDTTVADFNAGIPGTCVVDESIGDGALRLPLVLDEDFSGTSLPSEWLSTPWTGGTSTVSGGTVTVDGARLTPVSLTGWSPTAQVPVVMEFVATFNAAQYQNAGLGAGDNTISSTGMYATGDEPWAMFGTAGTADTLYTRLNPGGDVAIPNSANYIGSSHRYRIEWRADNMVEFFIDGASVGSRTATFGAITMRPGVSDYNAGGPSLIVDWLRMIPPYVTSCEFESRIHDGGELVDWTTLVATATLPSGTSISFDARSGNSSSPDISWTSWQAVNSGSLTNPGSQYIQYRARLTTTDPGQTPVVEDVTINYASGSLSRLTSPDGTLTDWDGSFIWTGARSDATWYLLEVYSPGGSQLYRKWYTSAQTNCSGSTACSLTPPDLALGNGAYQWRVMDYGAYGYGIWTYFKSFTLDAACYTLETSVSPEDSGSVTVPAESCTGGYLAGTVVQLKAVPGTGYTFSSWSGDAGGASNPVTVTMDADKSVTANMYGNTPLTPSGTITTWNGSFTWTGARSDATWYLIEVQTDGGTQVFRKWYTSSQTNCAGGTACSVTPTGLTLENEKYKWRVLDYGAYGYGINSAFKSFTMNSACYTLTTNVDPAGSGAVNVPAQSCTGGYLAGTVVQLMAVPGTGYTFSSWSGDVGGTVSPVTITMDGNKTVTAEMRGNTPLAPTGTQTSWANSFTWTGARSDATWYLVEVQTGGGTQVFRKWYTSAQAGCAGGTACSVTPSETAYLANGAYQWRVMDYGAYGYGLNSAFKTFTLDVTVVCTNIRYVDADSTAVTPDGCSWGTAYTSLQAALDDTGTFDQIWVAEGTYKPTKLLNPGDPSPLRTAYFGLRSGLAIYGGFKGNETSLAARNKNPVTNGTILSGDIGTPNVVADNAYQVVRGDGVSSSAVLDGFTITRGNSNGSSGHGGGIYLTASSPTMANLLISNNTASANGGGVYVISPNNNDPEADYSRPSFTDVTIRDNTAARGGGLFIQNASPTLTRVTFTSNLASSGAGGGINNQTLEADDAPSIPVLTDVTFNNNTSNGGGGMFNTNSSAVLNRVTFNGNTAKRRGGGMLNENNGNPVLTNVTFYGNQSTEETGAAPWGGGGMMNVSSSPTLNNVTFNGNNSVNGSGTAGGDAMRNAVNSNPVITNSILWGDLNDEITSDGTGTITIAYSVVQGGFAGGTNIITTNPNLQALANNGGFTQSMALGAGSSAVDQGLGCAASDQRGVTRPQGLVCDIGAYELDKVLLIAPSGTLGSWNNTFSWTGQSDATWYLLEVYTPDGATQVFRKWYTSPQTNCSGGVACSVSPAETAALSGTYKWRILEYGSFGYGVWTPYMNFSVP
jgi:hypothetical protein